MDEGFTSNNCQYEHVKRLILSCQGPRLVIAQLSVKTNLLRITFEKKKKKKGCYSQLQPKDREKLVRTAKSFSISCGPG